MNTILKSIGIALLGLLHLFGGHPALPLGDVAPIQTQETSSLDDKGTKYETFTPTSGKRGEIKTTFSKTEPVITAQKWDGEASIKITYDGISSQTPGSKTPDDKVEWAGNNQELQAYNLPKGDGMEDGGIEIQAVLHARPASQTLSFSVTGYENFEFRRQPPLNDPFWNFVGNKGIVSCTETQCLDGLGNVVESMPDNIVGAYAIHFRSASIFSIEGQVNKEGGLFGYVHRPRLTDGRGKKFWGTLKYVEGKFLVIIPDDVYNDPTIDWSTFIIDPTFGYQTLGALTDSTGKFANANLYVASTTCTTTQANYGGRMSSGTGTTTMAVYDQGDGNISGNNRLVAASGDISLDTTAAFRSVAYTLMNFVSGTSYYIEGYSNTTNVQTRYTAGVTDEFTSTGTVTNPPLVHATRGGTASQQMSIYFDCTAPVTSSPVRATINSLFNVRGLITIP